MSAARLVQDLPQRTESFTEESAAKARANERLEQDQAQADQSAARKAAKELAALEAKEAARIANEKFQEERRDAIYYEIPKFVYKEKVTTVHKGGKRTTSKGNLTKQYNAWKQKWASKVVHNKKMVEKFGQKWTAHAGGGFGRTVSRILSGEVAMSSGADALTVKQVASARNAASWNEGRITWGRYLDMKKLIATNYAIASGTETEHQHYLSTSKALGKASKGVQQNFGAGSAFSVVPAPIIKPTKQPSTNTGKGTTTDPFKASQPNKAMISPFLLAQQKKQSAITGSGSPQSNKANTVQDGSFIGYSPITGKSIQGAPAPQFTVTDSKGKVRTFDSADHANRFATRIQTESSFIGAIGNLENTFSVKESKAEGKIFDNKRYDNLGLAAQAGFGNALRYADAVDSGEVPKPEGLQWLNYYASHGVKPITDIAFHVDSAVTGKDNKIQPTFADTLIDVPIKLATTGKTETHDPIGDYIRDDPLRTIVQLPAEGAVWVAGGKAIQGVAKVSSKVSPVAYQTLKFPINNKMETVYRGLTIKDRPVVGIQSGKLVKGFDETKLPFQKIKPTEFGRYGWEPTQSTGIASKTIFAEKTLDSMVKRNVITPLSKERITVGKDLFESTKGVKTQVGKFSGEPVKDLTQGQSDYLLNFAAKGQKAGKVEAFHGSTALQPQISPALRTRAGSHLKMGDLDITVKGKSDIARERVASKMIRDIGDDFPLEKGQTLKVTDKAGALKTNKQLHLLTKGGVSTEPESGMVLFHGTTPEKARSILSEGFDVTKSKTSKGTIFTYTDSRSTYGHLGSNLKITMKKDVKVFDVNKQPNPQLSNNELRAIAKKDKADIITNMMQGEGSYGREIEILNVKAVKSIEPISGKVTGKYAPYNTPTPKDAKSSKILEIVLEERDASGINKLQVRMGDKVFDERLISKTVKTKDFGLKVHTRRFQQQENLRTVFQFHKGTKGSMFNVIPAEGRAKDIVRSYWNFKEDALRVGGTKGAAIDVKAEKFRSLYKGVTGFEDLQPEKVSLLAIKSPSIAPSTTQFAAGGISTKGAISLSEPALTGKVDTTNPFRVKGESPSLKATPKIRGGGSSSSSSTRSVTSTVKNPLKTSVAASSIGSSNARLFKSTLTPSVRSPLSSSPKSPSSFSPRSRSVKSPPTSKAPKSSSSRAPSITSPKSSGSPPSGKGGGGGRGYNSGFGTIGNAHGADPFRSTKRPKALPFLQIKNTTDTKKGKTKDPHDFLGNVRLDSIEGIFRRKEVIHGDRRLPKQIRTDKTKGFTSSKVKIF